MKANDIVTPLDYERVRSVFTTNTGKLCLLRQPSFLVLILRGSKLNVNSNSSSGEGGQSTSKSRCSEAKRASMIESGDILRKKGTFAALEKTIAYRKQQIEEFLATHWQNIWLVFLRIFNWIFSCWKFNFNFQCYVTILSKFTISRSKTSQQFIENRS